MWAARLSGDRPVVLAGIAGLTAFAWLDLWRRSGAVARGSTGMTMAVPGALSSGVPELLTAGAMWSIMMVAMMLPSATPMLLVLSGGRRAQRAIGNAGGAGGLFAVGFLLVWLSWAWLAAALQWALQAGLVLSPQLAVVWYPLAAVLLIIAGVYQFTPFKHACLSRCQSPLGFLVSQWREGPWGAVHMGIRYGVYCVGCCWALMGVLFVVGVMNLLWVAVLAVFVLVEKTALRGPWPGRLTGAALIVWALYLLGAAAM